jgi:CobQ-like glutamine amidotransferase family enzyme
MPRILPGGRVEVVVVYQSLLGIYGDRGNATVLLKRLHWRGYDAVLTLVEVGDPLPDTGDIYLLGGGEDAAQVAAVRALKADGGLQRAVDRGAAVFAVCAGYQIVGRSFTVGETDDAVEGLGLLDVTTTRGPTRAVGEILTRLVGREGDDAWVTGFENHGGYTELGATAQPLATVEIGFGNCGDGTEGAISGSVIGTYPHGPVLARNPALADLVLELALQAKLAPLVRPDVEELRRQRLRAARRGARHRPSLMSSRRDRQGRGSGATTTRQ